jgi:hypothetical protein
MTVLFAGCGGILASTTFRDQDAPHYIPGKEIFGGSFWGFDVVTRQD